MLGLGALYYGISDTGISEVRKRSANSSTTHYSPPPSPGGVVGHKVVCEAVAFSFLVCSPRLCKEMRHCLYRCLKTTPLLLCTALATPSRLYVCPLVLPLCHRRRLLSTTPPPPPPQSTMDLPAYVERLRGGTPAKFPADANSLDFAQTLDSQDKLSHLRHEFVLPTKTSIKKTALDGTLPCTFLHDTPPPGASSRPVARAHTRPPCIPFLLLPPGLRSFC